MRTEQLVVELNHTKTHITHTAQTRPLTWTHTGASSHSLTAENRKQQQGIHGDMLLKCLFVLFCFDFLVSVLLCVRCYFILLQRPAQANSHWGSRALNFARGVFPNHCYFSMIEIVFINIFNAFFHVYLVCFCHFYLIYFKIKSFFFFLIYWILFMSFLQKWFELSVITLFLTLWATDDAAHL